VRDTRRNNRLEFGRICHADRPSDSAKLLELPIPLLSFMVHADNEGRSGANMNRKNWSNLFIFVGAVNVALGVMPSNPVKVVSWIAVPLCVAMGVIARRRMI
jgi:hypothetical protein